MEHFKKCQKCGRYMTPYRQSDFGYVYTLWICPCGYSEDIGDTRADYITTYAGGYETAEEEGRLVVLPCKVGDYVWSNDYGRPCAFKVTEITTGEDGACIMVADDEQCSSASSYSFDDFGKVLFLTREEAEKALEEMEKDE